MRRLLYVFIALLIFISCKKEKQEQQKELQPKVVWESYDETEDLAATQKLTQTRMHLKLVNSKILDKNDIWKSLESELDYFSEDDYNRLKKFVIEKNIPSIQQSVKDGLLSYEELTKFYIYRIRKYESDNSMSLNSVISLNPKVVEQARALDKIDKNTIDVNSVFGMPIMLKDNIGAEDMKTTAGAIALQENETTNAFITKRLLDQNALILGKANLSEWAYFLCIGCPVGYSAVGGQTLNPYGRMVFETGGSSSGSGVTVAANFCVAAIGTETSGSILSPSSQNSIVGLKPTIGLLSRSGIVPISSTLDTPGPMTKNVIDNAILLNALIGKDENDSASVATDANYLLSVKEGTIKGKRFGVIKEFLEDTVYANAVDKIKIAGGEIVEIEPKQTPLPGFLSILNIDMKNDLPTYINSHASDNITVRTIQEAIAFNIQDTLTRIPYGQGIFEGIVNDSTTTEGLENIKENLMKVARNYFDTHLEEHNLDAVLSINNYHAGYAAVAKYPALTVPMGYTDNGEPKGLTFISKPFSEAQLLQLGIAYESITKERKMPFKYLD
ncbi:amidase family protein [Aquimarina sp. 2201CG14-23]|uniref:amidase family protein n=1 Tax=Aquimarina mycalae TaxID=3040073 RepID=UPI00247804A0|nr:amidase family protein [Aquimarina sp. 2201CG14-23]MDH7444404.1 amidase family protein [Aquimarina sp. 2201CG14-23]